MIRRIITYLFLGTMILANNSALAGFESETGNTGYGYGAGDNVKANLHGIAGPNNSFFGYLAGELSIRGSENTFVGSMAGLNNGGSSYNTFVGASSGLKNHGQHNTFIGRSAGENNVSGESNTFIGSNAGYENSAGWSNTFVGQSAGADSTSGVFNTFVGEFTGSSNTTGGYNTIVGSRAGLSNETGTGNVFLGYAAGYNETGSNKLHIDNTNTNSPLIYGEFDNDLVGINGKLAVGHQMPTASMHVKRSDGAAQVLVQETNSTSADRNLFQLENNGRTHFRMVDTTDAANKTWDFLASGAFFISRVGSGVTEFLLDGYGNLTISGSLTQSSSRHMKTNIASVDTQAVLDKILALPINEWNYKHDGPQVRHVGPMAEDFYQAFGLGATDKGISSVDTGGVALAAIQGLQKYHQEQLQILKNEKDAEIAALKEDRHTKFSALRKENTVLRRELTELRQMIQQLATRQQTARAYD